MYKWFVLAPAKFTIMNWSCASKKRLQFILRFPFMALKPCGLSEKNPYVFCRRQNIETYDYSTRYYYGQTPLPAESPRGCRRGKRWKQRVFSAKREYKEGPPGHFTRHHMKQCLVIHFQNYEKTKKTHDLATIHVVLWVWRSLTASRESFWPKDLTQSFLDEGFRNHRCTTTSLYLMRYMVVSISHWSGCHYNNVRYTQKPILSMYYETVECCG